MPLPSLSAAATSPPSGPQGGGTPVVFTLAYNASDARTTRHPLALNTPGLAPLCRFDATPGDDVLDKFADMAPREMRRAWMTAFGNARLDGRDRLGVDDLPQAGHAGKRGPLGFMN